MYGKPGEYTELKRLAESGDRYAMILYTEELARKKDVSRRRRAAERDLIAAGHKKTIAERARSNALRKRRRMEAKRAAKTAGGKQTPGEGEAGDGSEGDGEVGIVDSASVHEDYGTCDLDEETQQPSAPGPKTADNKASKPPTVVVIDDDSSDDEDLMTAVVLSGHKAGEAEEFLAEAGVNMSMPVGRKGRFVTDPCCAAYKVDTGKSQMKPPSTPDRVLRLDRIHADDSKTNRQRFPEDYKRLLR